MMVLYVHSLGHSFVSQNHWQFLKDHFHFRTTILKQLSWNAISTMQFPSFQCAQCFLYFCHHFHVACHIITASFIVR